MKHIASSIAVLAILLALPGPDAAAQYRDILWMRGTHTDTANTVKYSLTGDLVVSASRDSTVRLWEYSSGRLLRTLKLKASVTAIGIPPNGKSVVVGDRSGRLSVWNTDGTVARELTVFDNPVIAVEVRQLGTPGITYAVAADRGSIRVFELGPGTLRGTATITPDLVSLALTPNGNAVALGLSDGSIRMGSPMVLDMLTPVSVVTPGLTAVALNPEGTRVYVAYKDTIRTIDPMAMTHQDIGASGTIRTLSVHDEGWDMVAGTDSGFTAYRLTPQSSVPSPLNITSSPTVLGATFDRDATMLITCSSTGEITEWDMNTWEPTRTITRRVNNVTVSDNGRYLAAAGGVPHVLVWNNDGLEVASFDSAYHKVALNADGSTLAAARNKVVDIYDVGTRALLKSFTVPDSGFLSRLRFLPNDELLVVTAYSMGNTVCAAGQLRSTGALWNPLTGTRTRALFEGRIGLEELAVSSDGSRLATSGPFIPCDGAFNILPIQTMDVETTGGRLAFPNNALYVTSLTVSSAAPIIAAAERVPANNHRLVRLWDAGAGTPYDTVGEDGMAYSVAFSPTGAYLASGRYDGRIRFVDVITRRQIYAFNEYAGPQRELFFASRERTFVSRTDDGAMIVWSTEHLDSAASSSVPLTRKPGPSIHTSPNPVAGHARFSFTLETGTHLRAVITAADGREVARLAGGRYDAGSHTLEWDTRDVGAGIYFCRVDTEAGISVCKVIVQ